MDDTKPLQHGLTAGLPQESYTEPRKDYYKTLNRERKEIRLLVVEPGPVDTVVCCTFRQAFLDDQLNTYETVSYVWGDPTNRKTIFLEGHPVSVPASSERVLQRMRPLENQPRILWLDAVCIDQGNDREKSAQVAIMGDIYSRSSSNLIWLGEEDDTTESAVSSLHAIHNEMLSKTSDGATFLDMAYPAGELTILDKGIEVDHDCLALAQFFNSSWFTRLWVCPEATLSSRSICYYGRFQVPLKVVLRTALWITSCREGCTKCSMDIALPFCLAEWADPEYGYNRLRLPAKGILLSLMVSMRAFETEEQRDHVFALIGIWKKLSKYEEMPPELTPDYSASPMDVLQNAIRFTIRERGDLKALQYVSHRANDAHPTWVPRLDRSLDAQDSLPFLHIGQCADGGVALDVELALSVPEALVLKGCVLGTIHRVSKTFGVADINYFMLSNLDETEEIVLATDPADDSSLQDLVGHTLQAGVTSSRVAADISASGRMYAAYKHRLATDDSHYFEPTREDGEVNDFRLSIDSACTCRKVFSTLSGYFGLGPQDLQKGDLVTVLNGSSFPVILRPVSPGIFECVGEAYVHGVMEGQVVRGAHREQVTFEVR